MMRILLLVLIHLALIIANAYGLIDQKLSIRIIPAEHRLEAEAVLTNADGQKGMPSVFRLAKQAEINTVTADDKPVPFVFEEGLLQIKEFGDAATLTMNYHVLFDDPVPQDRVGIEDPSLGVTATIMPQGTFLSAKSGWHPLPVGSLSHFRVTVTAPSETYGVTAGRLTNLESNADRAVLTWQTQRPQAALALAVGRYQVQQDNFGEIQLLVFTSAENAALAPGYLKSCRDYLQLYQEIFGPYPYAKFAVVENFYPTGYGLPGWTLFGNSVIRLPFIRTTSLPHEIAHTWWGNAIEIDYAKGNWAEGLATYVADYYLKELHAPDQAKEYRRKILRDYATLIDIDDDMPLTAFRSRTTKRDQAVGYGKTAMVFHMLRNLIGDESFWSGLQTAAREGLGKRYAWIDLQRHFEASSDTELTAFFRQWTERAGAPQLQLTDVSLMPVDNGWQVSGLIRQEKPLYDLAVPLRLETATRSYEQTLGMTEAQDCFLFTVSERPTRLSVDPENSLFRKLYPEELPPTVNNLRASRTPLVVVATGSESLLEASGDLLRGLQWHQAPIMSEKEYLSLRPTDKDLLVLGWSQGSELRPELPDGFSTSGRQIVIGDKLYADAEDALFFVLPGHTEKRVIGYFLPGSPAAARDTARRISHYGRYSTLAFHDGINQVKSTWEPVSSPLQLLFPKDAAP